MKGQILDCHDNILLGGLYQFIFLRNRVYPQENAKKRKNLFLFEFQKITLIILKTKMRYDD